MAKSIKKEILFEELNSLIPSLLSARHKGQNGKLGVIGGSFEYTGAPYYGAAAGLRGGGDLTHIFCTEKAATAIKSYSPEIIVHPYLLSEQDLKRSANEDEVKDCVKNITKWYEALHGCVIGSGLGRDNAVASLIEDLYSEQKDIVTVCDGDFFWFLSEKNKHSLAEKIRKRAKQTILTPNKVEFKRIWEMLKGKEAQRTSEDEIKKEIEHVGQSKAPIVEVELSNPIVKDAVEIAKNLHNVNLLMKGEYDVITNGKSAYLVKLQGCYKRCGGQGDVMAGLAALYGFWDKQAKEKEEISVESDDYNLLKGCMMASYITRYAGGMAFNKYKYGLTTPFLLDELPFAINHFIDRGLEESVVENKPKL